MLRTPKFISGLSRTRVVQTFVFFVMFCRSLFLCYFSLVMVIVMVIVFAAFLLPPSDYPFWYLQTFLNVIKRLKKRNTENDCCISIGASYPSVIQPPIVLCNMKILATALPVLSPFITYHRVCNYINTTGATS